jgi:hypothetical protein
MASWVRTEKIQRLEEMSDDEVLGLPNVGAVATANEGRGIQGKGQ